MSSAVVIGNGESRVHVDPLLLSSDNTLIGCNAIHRDLKVDHLICCDRRMIDEALVNPKTTDTLIYVRENWFHHYRTVKEYKNILSVPDLPFPVNQRADEPIHWGSGGYAVLLAATLGFTHITLIGFDLYGVNDKVNNIYKGTNNYANGSSHAIDPSYWIYQIGLIFAHFKTVKFTIVNHPDWKLPPQWANDNVNFSPVLVDL